MKKYFAHKNTAKRCHIYQALQQGAKQKHLSFHTPGHKIAGWDVTELSYSDCLANPTGCILAAQTDVEKIVGAKASEFLTDGSTSGVYALMYLLKEKGVKKVAVSPFSHISVFRACVMFGIEPLLIEGQTATSQPTKAQMEEAVSKADALLLTSPNYYGKIANLAAARSLCDSHSKPFIVDGAHGGHLHYQKENYAGAYADGWVDGAHKSMPAMTQGALVSVVRADWVEDFRRIVPMFRTTSPSYPILASIEYAFKYPKNEVLERSARAFIQDNSHRIYQSDDWTKVCVRFDRHAQSANDWLESKGVFPEFCDGKNLLFYLSPATKTSQFNALKKWLLKAFALFPVEEEKEEILPEKVEKSGRKEYVLLENAVDRVAASSFGIFPPCLPLVVDGQRIKQEDVARMQGAKHTFGVVDGKVAVYTEGEEL